ncbi:DoxX family protein, partial [Acinetobacter baumannii]
LSGLTKLSQYEGTQAYMASAGVPTALLPLVIALEIGGSLAVIAGFRTRLVAVLLAGVSLVSAVLFHAHFQDQIQMIMFLKNVSIAGGFL